jgi:UDP-N-acetylmuramate dehydrogenase
MTVATELDRLDALAAARGIALERDVALGPWTTLRVGGPADRLATPRSGSELVSVLELARAAGVRSFVLGKGSDLVIGDAGMRGLVIRNRADGVRTAGPAGRWVAESGTAMARIVKQFAALGLTGLEFGISIPGSLGGAVWANAGAHEGEMRDIVRAVEVYDPRDGGQHHLDAAECAFAYRDSRFKHTPEVVVEVTIELADGDPAEIGARVAAHQAQRRATQPLADQNAGSVFRNPPEDHAGRLIDVAGLKGFRIGSAQVSTLHANFIVADRGGRAADVRAVGDHMRAVVADRFGIELAYEIEFVGDWAEAADA